MLSVDVELHLHTSHDNLGPVVPVSILLIIEPIQSSDLEVTPHADLSSPETVLHLGSCNSRSALMRLSGHLLSVCLLFLSMMH